jgi:hypothetical protein
MLSIRFRDIAIGLFAVTAFVTQAPAQAAPSGILTNLEVKQLITRGEPADHARLRSHFTALADQYEADAKAHNAMARAFVQNPGRRVAANRSADHCRRLEALATQSAATVRELAMHHATLAAGFPSRPPSNSARFEGGEGARVVEVHDREIHDLAAKATTPADHRAIEEYFKSLEKRYNAEVSEHVAMAQAYRAAANRRGGGDPAAHCDRLVKASREAANEARAIAAEHEQAASVAR